MEGGQCNSLPIVAMLVKYDFLIPGKSPLHLSVLIPLPVVS